MTTNIVGFDCVHDAVDNLGLRDKYEKKRVEKVAEDVSGGDVDLLWKIVGFGNIALAVFLLLVALAGGGGIAAAGFIFIVFPLAMLSHWLRKKKVKEVERIAERNVELKRKVEDVEKGASEDIIKEHYTFRGYKYLGKLFTEKKNEVTNNFMTKDIGVVLVKFENGPEAKVDFLIIEKDVVCHKTYAIKDIVKYVGVERMDRVDQEEIERKRNEYKEAEKSVAVHEMRRAAAKAKKTTATGAVFDGSTAYMSSVQKARRLKNEIDNELKNKTYVKEIRFSDGTELYIDHVDRETDKMVEEQIEREVG